MDFLYLILVAVLLAFGFIMLKPLRQIIRIRRVPPLPIAAVPTTGQVKVIGRAKGSILLSPISDTSCVLWHVEVQEYRGTGKSGRWVTILKQTSGQSIQIDDDTGRILVVPAGAELVLDDDLRASRGLFGNMTPQVAAALERMGISLRSVLGMKRALRVREQLLLPGEQIYALGLVEVAAGQLRLCSTLLLI
jgi:E3 Ubiquitin ligase